jgi:hypothetical protein
MAISMTDKKSGALNSRFIDQKLYLAFALFEFYRQL